MGIRHRRPHSARHGFVAVTPIFLKNPAAAWRSISELPCSIFLSPYPSGNSFEHPRMYFLSVSVHSNRQPSVSISGFRANRGIQRLPWPPRLLWHPAPPVAFISQLSARIERDLIHFSARIPLRLSVPSRTASTPLLSISRYPTIPPVSCVLLRYSCASQGVSPDVSHSTLPPAPALPKQAAVGTRSPQSRVVAVDAVDSEASQFEWAFPTSLVIA